MRAIFILAASSLLAAPAAAGAATVSIDVPALPAGAQRQGAVIVVPYNAELTFTGVVLDDAGAPAPASTTGGVYYAWKGTPLESPVDSATLSTVDGGTYSARLTIKRNGNAFASVDPQPGFNVSRAFSPVIAFEVVPRITIIKGGVSKRRILYGSVDTLKASDGRVLLQRRVGTSWRTVKTLTAPAGQWRTVLNRPKKGRYRALYRPTSPDISREAVSKTIRL